MQMRNCFFIIAAVIFFWVFAGTAGRLEAADADPLLHAIDNYEKQKLFDATSAGEIKKFIQGFTSRHMTPRSDWDISISVSDKRKDPSFVRFLTYFPDTVCVITISGDYRGCEDDCPINIVKIAYRGNNRFYDISRIKTWNEFVSEYKLVINDKNCRSYAEMVFENLGISISRFSRNWKINANETTEITIKEKTYKVRIPLLKEQRDWASDMKLAIPGDVFIDISDKGRIVSFSIGAR